MAITSAFPRFGVIKHTEMKCWFESNNRDQSRRCGFDSHYLLHSADWDGTSKDKHLSEE